MLEEEPLGDMAAGGYRSKESGKDCAGGTSFGGYSSKGLKKCRAIKVGV